MEKGILLRTLCLSAIALPCGGGIGRGVPQTPSPRPPPSPTLPRKGLSYSHIFLSPINGLRVRESGFFRIRSLDLLFGGRFLGHLESSRVERSVEQVHPSQRCVNPVAIEGEGQAPSISPSCPGSVLILLDCSIFSPDFVPPAAPFHHSKKGESFWFNASRPSARSSRRALNPPRPSKINPSKLRFGLRVGRLASCTPRTSSPLSSRSSTTSSRRTMTYWRST